MRPLPHANHARVAAVVASLVLTVASAAGPAFGTRSAGNPVSEAAGAPYAASRNAAGADSNSPESTQRRYDAARDLQNTLPAATSRACQPLLDALRRYADAEVAATEAYDRLLSAERAKQLALSSSAAAAVERARAGCTGSGATPADEAPAAPLLEPGSGEAFTGTISVRVPPRAARAVFSVDGAQVAAMPATPGTVATHNLPAAPRSIKEILVRFNDASGNEVGVAGAQTLSLLPSSAWKLRPLKPDAGMNARLVSLATVFSGISAVAVSDFARGREARWNDQAKFPAASTVKLGVLAAALRRYAGARRRLIMHEMETITGWSSNLAANRLFRLAGGEPAALSALKALGAAVSSYPGEYRAGTARHRVQLEPPLVSRRVTTAADLNAILVSLLRAAGATARARGTTGLTGADARLVLGGLVRFENQGDNAGLFGPFLLKTMPFAEKNGWISSARHSAAVAFTSAGPVVIIVLTYRDTLTLADAQQLGRNVLSRALGG